MYSRVRRASNLHCPRPQLNVNKHRISLKAAFSFPNEILPLSMTAMLLLLLLLNFSLLKDTLICQRSQGTESFSTVHGTVDFRPEGSLRHAAGTCRVTWVLGELIFVSHLL